VFHRTVFHATAHLVLFDEVSSKNFSILEKLNSSNAKKCLCNHNLVIRTQRPPNSLLNYLQLATRSPQSQITTNVKHSVTNNLANKYTHVTKFEAREEACDIDWAPFSSIVKECNAKNGGRFMDDAS
jgi:hypothetical protein